MKLIKIICAIAIAAISTAQGTAHLIGISNKTGAQGGQGFPTPNIGVSGTNITSIPYTVNNVGLQPIKQDLPVSVTLTYGSNINEGKPYTIKIEEAGGLGNCQGNTRTIRASVVEGNLNDAQTCCVTLAKNPFSASGDSYEWENVVLALANNPNYGTDTKALPFIFGIAPWTSTKYPWNKMAIDNPADAKKGSAKQFTHEWTEGPENGLVGLKVMQGNTGWIGGDITQNLLPKKAYNHITHIYNNTPYVLNIARNSRGDNAGANFSQLLPPWSATPWTMAWIPIVPKDKFNPDVDQQLSAIQIYALYAPEKDQPKLPGALPILTKAGSTEFSYNKNTSDMLANLESGHSPYISKLLGETPIRDLMPNMDQDQYAVGNSYFRIFTLDNFKGQTYIQKCNNTTQECADYAKVDFPKTIAGDFGSQFGYYKLIVNVDPNSKEGDIQLGLSPAPYETVLEH